MDMKRYEFTTPGETGVYIDVETRCRDPPET